MHTCLYLEPICPAIDLNDAGCQGLSLQQQAHAAAADTLKCCLCYGDYRGICGCCCQLSKTCAEVSDCGRSVQASCTRLRAAVGALWGWRGRCRLAACSNGMPGCTPHGSRR